LTRDATCDESAELQKRGEPSLAFCRIAASYGNNGGRLLRAKASYDPDNVFASAIPLPSRS
jgi:hypothetical protein